MAYDEGLEASVATTRAPDRPITGDELLAMGDVGPCELIDGRIVPMSPAGGEHAIGVERVWIVEPDNRAVLVHRSPSEAQRLGESDILKGEGPLDGFTLPVAALFAE